MAGRHHLHMGSSMCPARTTSTYNTYARRDPKRHSKNNELQRHQTVAADASQNIQSAHLERGTYSPPRTADAAAAASAKRPSHGARTTKSLSPTSP